MSQGQVNPNFPITTSNKTASILPPDCVMSDEGSYFVASSVNAGVVNTGSTDTLAKTQVNPNLVIQNQWPAAANAMSIYLRYIKINVVTIPTGPASWNYGLFLDNLTNKITTPATVLTPYNVNSNSGVLSKAYISVGANTTVTGSAAVRVLGQTQFCGAIPVVLDQWVFTFGEPSGSGGFISGATSTVSMRIIPLAPVVIAPTWTFTLGTWATTYTTASQYAWEIGFVERPSGQ